MKILHRYLYSEIFFHMVLGILVINTLIMVEKLIRVSKVLSGIAGPLDMARIILLIQPQVLLITIPVAYLIAILLVFGRMNMDNELLALRAGGIGLRSISVPVIKTGLVLLIFTLIVSTFIAPHGNRRLRKEINGLIKKGIPKKIEEKTFADLGEMVIYTDRKDGEILRDVFIYLKKNKGVLTAKRALISTEGSAIVMELVDGFISMVKDNKKTDIYFGRYVISGILSVRGLSKKPGELLLHELLEEAKKGDRRKYLSYMMEFYRRFTYPLFSIVIALIGPGLSLLAGRTGRAGGLAVGVLFLLAFYMFSLYLEGLVEAEKISPLTGSLLPLVTGFILGLIFYVRSRKS